MGSLLALYGSTMHSSCSMWFSGHFFSCLVCGLLERKNEKMLFFIQLVQAYLIVFMDVWEFDR
jgi:hypothetical protein